MYVSSHPRLFYALRNTGACAEKERGWGRVEWAPMKRAGSLKAYSSLPKGLGDETCAAKNTRGVAISTLVLASLFFGPCSVFSPAIRSKQPAPFSNECRFFSEMWHCVGIPCCGQKRRNVCHCGMTVYGSFSPCFIL